MIFRLSCDPLESRDTPAPFVTFDYTYDTAGFFNDPNRRLALERVAETITVRLADDLTAIAPGGGNTWTAGFYNPFTDRTVSRRNLRIAADEVLIFVGGGPLTSSELALTSGGSFQASGTPNWLNTVRGRGQAGALTDPPTDDAGWGGFIGFDSGVTWNFGTDQPTENEFDFESVAAHELMHIFGFGLGNGAFSRLVSNSTFIGPAAQAVFGGPVPVNPGEDPDHWASRTSFGGVTPIMVPSIPPGEKRAVSELDFAALDDLGWDVVAEQTVPPAVPPVATTEEPPPGEGTPVRFAVGADAGTVPAAAGVNAAGEFVYTLAPFDGEFTGGTRVASADFNRDGRREIVVGTGPGGASDVRILDGATDAELFRVEPFEAAFLGGVYVAAGDLDGDGIPELVVTPDEGGGPRVRVFDGSTFTVRADFFGIDDPNFRGGARAAVGDIDGDGVGDLVVAAGFGGGPRVTAYTGASVGTDELTQVFGDFFAFEETLRNGVYVAVGDLNGDGFGELVVGGGPGGGPRVTAFDGASLAQNALFEQGNFFAGDVESRGGVRVAVADLDGDANADLVTGAGTDAGSRLSGYAGAAVVTGGSPEAVFDFDFYPGFSGGLFVG